MPTFIKFIITAPIILFIAIIAVWYYATPNEVVGVTPSVDSCKQYVVLDSDSNQWGRQFVCQITSNQKICTRLEYNNFGQCTTAYVYANPPIPGIPGSVSIPNQNETYTVNPAP